ncbi:hypothetical protein V866_003037 [Kwoniella sp. B9012]
MTNYNPLMSSYTIDSHGNLSLTNPTGSSALMCRQSGTGRLMYEDSKGNFTVVEKEGKVTSVDIYVENGIEDDDTPSSENGHSDSPTSESLLMPWELPHLTNKKSVIK